MAQATVMLRYENYVGRHLCLGTDAHLVFQHVFILQWSGE